ncbi:MAG: GNAT family N-acetyltransferase [Nanoarchaeota archaeon]|nr:GNAT family N-acetyltransferase [Nanoarchaeota archaeon]MBU0962316.1 GNAT family N-acetyltransferase [Nanoarchaeota archaeon]
MKKLLLPKDFPLIKVNGNEFDDLEGLEQLMNKFPYSSRDPEFLKYQLDKDKYFLWVVDSKEKGPVGYILCSPNMKNFVNRTPAFYVVERFTDKNYRNMLICSRLVGTASKYARDLGKKCIYEEVDLSNDLGLKSSASLGFEEITKLRRGKDTYSIRRKYLR